MAGDVLERLSSAAHRAIPSKRSNNDVPAVCGAKGLIANQSNGR